MSKRGYKDMEKFRKNRNEYNRRYRQRYVDLATKKHTRYTEEEKMMIMEHAMSDLELARLLHRSPSAITNARAVFKRQGWNQDGK